jgi:anthranilate-CoA ligase
MTMTNLARELLERNTDAEAPLYYYGDDVIRHGAFRKQVARIASLLEQKVRPGQFVVIALNDTPLLAALFLATIAVGAIPALINPRLNLAQTAAICTDCNASLFITHEERNELLHPVLSELIPNPILYTRDNNYYLDLDNDLDLLLMGGSERWIGFHCSPPNTACYIQYTSGSTGAPKGVIHTCATTLGFCRSFAQEHLGLQASDRLYSVPKMFFGYGMGNSLFFPLYTGASAVLDQRWPDPAAVAANLARYRPTVLFAVPAMYRALRAQAATLAPSIRIAFSAGAPLPAAEFTAWQERGLELCDGIGATEVGHVFLANAPGHARAGVTGLPLAGYHCALLDEAGQVISGAGQAGVLVVRGPGVSPGYWNGAGQGFADGAYRTGDLFVRNDDGSYTYQGREDDKFKVNGRWVVPIAVERALCEQFPDLAEAVLVPSTREHDGARPTLFITLQPGGAAMDQARLEGWLQTSVESHSQPRRIVHLDAMPRNDNGKLVKHALVQHAAALLQAEGHA